MIDPNKKYRTHGGSPVKLYSVKGAPPYPVHGAYWDEDSWIISQWTEDGRFTTDCQRFVLDLVEVTEPEEEE